MDCDRMGNGATRLPAAWARLRKDLIRAAWTDISGSRIRAHRMAPAMAGLRRASSPFPSRALWPTTQSFSPALTLRNASIDSASVAHWRAQPLNRPFAMPPAWRRLPSFRVLSSRGGMRPTADTPLADFLHSWNQSKKHKSIDREHAVFSSAKCPKHAPGVPQRMRP